MLRVLQAKPAHLSRHKTPPASRKASTQVIPVDRLKQDIRAASASDDPIPRLLQLRQSPVYEEVWQATTSCATLPRNDPEAAQLNDRLAAEAFTTCHALDAVVRLSNAYNFSLTLRTRKTGDGRQGAAEDIDHAFLGQITPEHTHKLVTDFQCSWRMNGELRQAAILSAISPEAAARLELPSTAAHREHAQAWGTPLPGQQLSTAELLALVDYVHSGTGTFNAVNGAAMAAAYYGDKTLSGLMAVYSTALEGAVAKLCAHPYFGKTDIVTYKGINLRNPSGRFRLKALEAAVGSGRLVAFPGVLSATADPERSYAVQKYAEGYTIECRIRMEKAFDADPFHDELTMGEQEVIGPAGQRFVVVEKQSVEVFQPTWGTDTVVDRYLLEPAAAGPR